MPAAASTCRPTESGGRGRAARVCACGLEGISRELVPKEEVDPRAPPGGRRERRPLAHTPHRHQAQQQEAEGDPRGARRLARPPRVVRACGRGAGAVVRHVGDLRVGYLLEGALGVRWRMAARRG